MSRQKVEYAIVLQNASSSFSITLACADYHQAKKWASTTMKTHIHLSLSSARGALNKWNSIPPDALMHQPSAPVGMVQFMDIDNVQALIWTDLHEGGLESTLRDLYPGSM
jgi:hypothetical protein